MRYDILVDSCVEHGFLLEFDDAKKRGELIARARPDAEVRIESVGDPSGLIGAWIYNRQLAVWETAVA